MMKLMSYIYNRFCNTKDHDSEYSSADLEPAARKIRGGLILCPFGNVTRVREPTLPRILGGPQVDPEVLVVQHN